MLFIHCVYDVKDKKY